MVRWASVNLDAVRHFVSTFTLHLVLHRVEKRRRNVDIRWPYVARVLKVRGRADHGPVYSPSGSLRLSRGLVAAREPLKPNFTAGTRHFVYWLLYCLSTYLHSGYKIRKTFPRNGRGANLNILKSNFEVLVRNLEALGMRTIYRSNVIDRRSRYALNFILVLD